MRIFKQREKKRREKKRREAERKRVHVRGRAIERIRKSLDKLGNMILNPVNFS